MRKTVVFFVLAVVLAVSSASQAHASFTPCSPRGDDPAFLELGNGCIDVQHYNIALRYNPADGQLSGTTTLELITTAAVTNGFWLDLDGMQVRAVRVNGEAVGYSRQGANLHVAIARSYLPPQTALTVAVDYGGVPGLEATKTLVSPGWQTTLTGHVMVAEPDGASLWYPSNDIPWDTARHTITITTPPGFSAIANGLPSRTRTETDGSTTVTWSQKSQMSPYLAFIAVGR